MLSCAVSVVVCPMLTAMIAPRIAEREEARLARSAFRTESPDLTRMMKSLNSCEVADGFRV
jgi:hypothetical protein